MGLTDQDKNRLLEQYTHEVLGGTNAVAEAQERLSNIERLQNLAKRTARVDLAQALNEERQRKKTHPTHGSTSQIPDRWTSTGKKPQVPGSDH